VFLKASRIAIAAAIGLVGAAIAAPIPAMAATSSPVSVGIVVPLSVPAGRDGFISATELESLTSPNGLLFRELDSIADTSVTIGIDPMIIASIRLLGSDAPESATAWLERLRGVENDTFALTYADSDLTLGLQAGSTEVLAPISFDFAIKTELFGAPLDGTPSPTETPDPEAETPDIPPLPTSATLVEWPYTLTNVAWPQADTATSADLTLLGETGYTTAVLNSSNVSRSSEGASLTTIGDVDTVVTDDSLSALFAATIHSESSAEWQDAFEVLSDAIEAAPRRAGGASVTLAVGRGDFDTETRLRGTLVALDNLTTVNTVDLSSIVASTPGSGKVIAKPHTEVALQFARSMLGQEQADAQFSSVAENPLLITGDRRIRLLAASAPQWSRYPGGWGNEVDGFLEDSHDLRASVRITESSTLLFGDRGFIPINVSNGLDQPVTVYITVKPLTPLLTIENSRFELVVEPDSQRRAQIPAVARSNGEVSLSVSMRTGTDVPLGGTKWVRANVQAGWETPVTVGLGILVFAIFVLGIIRSIRRRRREKEAEKQAEDDEVIIAELDE